MPKHRGEKVGILSVFSAVINFEPIQANGSLPRRFDRHRTPGKASLRELHHQPMQPDHCNVTGGVLQYELPTMFLCQCTIVDGALLSINGQSIMCTMFTLRIGFVSFSSPSNGLQSSSLDNSRTHGPSNFVLLDVSVW